MNIWPTYILSALAPTEMPHDDIHLVAFVLGWIDYSLALHIHQ